MGNSIILVAVFILILAGFGSYYALHSAAPSPQTSQANQNSQFSAAPVAEPTEAGKLQIATHPITQAKPAESAQPNTLTTTVDFSSPTLDWEDVIALIGPNGHNVLHTLSASCQDDLNQASIDEVGNAEGTLSPPGANSRIALCWQSVNCVEHGYSAYDGSTPLPPFVPSQSCQQELQNVFKNISHTDLPPNINDQRVLNDVFSSTNTNCDSSDLICVDHTQFCSTLRSLGYEGYQIFSTCN